MRSWPTGRRALLFVLVVTTGVPHAFAQQFVCYPVRPGDTAARFALRLTGSAENRHAPWFRIVDTDASRIVPKSEYGHIRPGWRVCVASGSARPQSVQIGFTERRSPIDLGFRRGAAALLILLTAWLAWLVAMRNLGERQTILDTMRRFGHKFVREFERPLFRRPEPRRVETGDADHPVRSRLRFAPRRERLEILLAPHDGRTYPNLSDHRRNLEYDIERVLHLLGDEPFVSGRLYAEGPWVVVPFHLKTDGKQEGVT